MSQHDRPAPDWSQGYLHVYTGDGKGKTTAALGLALRAAGAGLRVYIAQFIKGMPYAEHAALERFAGQIDLEQHGRGCFIRGAPEQADIDAALAGLEAVRRALTRGYRLVVLDEANIATQLGLISVDALLEVIEARPADVELVVTGRGADARLLERADLVTEMREVKHYYTRGIEARTGVEM